MEPILELKQVSFSYHTLKGETPALSDISFSVDSGEFIAIVGPSGSGKSTLLSIISGLLTPEKGEVKVNGSFGYMLQHDHLFEWRNVYKNTILGLEIQGLITEETEQKALKMLNTYGLDAFAKAKPSELSGGMRQRAALVRTLILAPEILLLDEPFSALDYQTRLTVGDDIGKILRREEKTAILVTHDLSEAISLADRVLILSKRPATIQRTVPLEFKIETDNPLKRRNSQEFKDYFNLIWKELNQNV